MLKVTKVSNDAQVDGVWTDDYNDVSLLIARADSANYNYDNVLTKRMAPHKKKLENNKSIPNAVAKKIMISVAAEAVLLGWNKTGHKGEIVLDDEGNPAVYSLENAVDLLTIDPDLKKFVDDFAGDLDNFLDTEEIAKK